MTGIFSKRNWFIPVVLIGIIVVSLMILSVILPAKEKFGILTNPSTLPAENASVVGKGWNKIFAGDFDSRINSVQQTLDGGYIGVGYKMYGVIYPSGRNDTQVVLEKSAVYLLRTDANGNKVWDKSFGGLSMSACSDYLNTNTICNLNWNKSEWLTEVVGHSVQQTSDGGYVIAGSYHTGKLSIDPKWFTYDKGDEVFIIKTDADGNMQWNKTFGEYYNEVGYSVQQTSDGGYIIVGTTASYGVCPWCAKEMGGPAPEDIYLIKTDANGNKMWEKVIGGIYTDMAYSVKQTSDGGYIIAGGTGEVGGELQIDYNPGVNEPWLRGVYLVKTDSDGNKLWGKTFGRSDRAEAGRSVQQTSDGGYVIVGETSWSGHASVSIASGQNQESADVYLIKTDANGNELWERTFGGDHMDEGYSVEQTSDGGYVIAGMSFYLGVVPSMYLIKTDTDGNKIWQRTFESSWYGATSVQQTSDGGYIIAGGNENKIRGSGSKDAYLIKTDENGNV